MEHNQNQTKLAKQLELSSPISNNNSANANSSFAIAIAITQQPYNLLFDHEWILGP